LECGAEGAAFEERQRWNKALRIQTTFSERYGNHTSQKAAPWAPHSKEAYAR
jgi:hypothetical protein